MQDKNLTATDKEPRKRKPNELARVFSPSLALFFSSKKYLEQVREQTAFDHRERFLSLSHFSALPASAAFSFLASDFSSVSFS